MQVMRLIVNENPELIQRTFSHVVVLDPDSVKSLEEIRLAYSLASSSFKDRRNIARNFKYEFLLWLSGKTDIRRALRYFTPKGREVIAVIFSKKELKEFKKKILKKKPLSLENRAEPLSIERISLSRI